MLITALRVITLPLLGGVLEPWFGYDPFGSLKILELILCSIGLQPASHPSVTYPEFAFILICLKGLNVIRLMLYSY